MSQREKTNADAKAPDGMACLVYVQGLHGPSPQIWYEPMVNEYGKAMIEARNMVGEPIPLPPSNGGRRRL